MYKRIHTSAPGDFNQAPFLGCTDDAFGTLGLDPDVEDHGFVTDRSGNLRDTRCGKEVEITDLKWPRRQVEYRGLGVYIGGVVHVYDRTLGRVSRG
jgi:hypothetical protein